MGERCDVASVDRGVKSHRSNYNFNDRGQRKPFLFNGELKRQSSAVREMIETNRHK